MVKNVGSMDQKIRFAVGVAAIIIGVLVWNAQDSVLALVVGLVVGAIMLVTGATSTCPIWSALGVNTRRVD
jgi:uncharacterized membrane protein HdeD (DUF308 family)